MSLNGLRIGGQCPSPPPTFRDNVIVGIGMAVILALLLGPPVYGICWWVFG